MIYFYAFFTFIWMVHLPLLQDLYKKGKDVAVSESKGRLASQHFYVNAYDPDRDGDYIYSQETRFCM